MDLNPEKSYYWITKVLLQYLGIWHNDNSTLKVVKVIVAYGAILSSIFVQFASLSTPGSGIDDVLSVLATAIPCYASCLKYTSFLLQADKIRTIWQTIQADWYALKKETAAIGILRKYAEETRFLTRLFLWTMCWGVVNFICLLFLPRFLDFAVPLNQSRPKALPIAVEYFVDRERHFSFICTHITFVFGFNVTTIVTTEITLLIFLQHACGMFKITGHRLEHAADDLAHTHAPFETDRVVYENIVTAVKIHSHAIRFVEYVWESFVTPYVILILIGVASISINMFRFFRAVTMGAGMVKMFGFCAFFLAQFGHLFLCNLFAQRLIDHSMEISEKTYTIPWYNVSPRTKKLLLFVLQRTMKKTAFVALSLFTASLEGFSTLASASFSYFTVIYSML